MQRLKIKYWSVYQTAIASLSDNPDKEIVVNRTDDGERTLIEVLRENGIAEAPIISTFVNGKLTHELGFYYLDDVLYTNFLIGRIKIKDIDEYLDVIDGDLKVYHLNGGGLGFVSDSTEFVMQIYTHVNNFILSQPLGYILLAYGFNKFKKKYNKIYNEIANNLYNYSRFLDGLNYKSEFDIDTFTKAYRLERIRTNTNKYVYFIVLNNVLKSYGYSYRRKSKKWTKNN